MKKIILMIVCLAFLICSLQAKREKVATLDELMIPSSMSMDNENIYVVEKATIYIYSFKDYKFVGKFGKAGEGPKEFKVPQNPNPFFSGISLFPMKDKILVSSIGKISYWTKKGEFINEMKTKDMFSALYKELNNGTYAAMSTSVSKEQNISNGVSLYKKDLDKLKLLEEINIGNPTKKIKVLDKTVYFDVDDKNVYVVADDNFVIKVYDHEGKEKFVISRDYKRAKFTAKVKDEITKATLEMTPEPAREYVKNMLQFPEKFPAIMSVFPDDNKLYVFAWGKDVMEGKLKVFVYDREGKFIRETLVIAKMQEGQIKHYPGVINKGYYYQIIENQDEEWELFREKI